MYVMSLNNPLIKQTQNDCVSQCCLFRSLISTWGQQHECVLNTISDTKRETKKYATIDRTHNQHIGIMMKK